MIYCTPSVKADVGRNLRNTVRLGRFPITQQHDALILPGGFRGVQQGTGCMKAKLRKGAAVVIILRDGIDLLLQRSPVRVGIKACVRLLEIVDDQRDARGAVLSQQRVHEGICGGLRFCHTVFFGCLARIHAVRIIDDQHDVGGRLIIFALNTERDLPCVFLALDSGSAFAELDRALFGPDGLLTVVCEDGFAEQGQRQDDGEQSSKRSFDAFHGVSSSNDSSAGECRKFSAFCNAMGVFRF